MDSDLGDVLRAFPPLSLRDLDQRAALLQRVDRKYAVDRISLSNYRVGISLVDTGGGEPQPGRELFE